MATRLWFSPSGHGFYAEEGSDEEKRLNQAGYNSLVDPNAPVKPKRKKAEKPEEGTQDGDGDGTEDDDKDDDGEGE